MMIGEGGRGNLSGVESGWLKCDMLTPKDGEGVEHLLLCL